MKTPEFIDTCEICTRIPQGVDLEDKPRPKDYDRLEKVYSKDTGTERYESDIHIILKCPRCITFYHHNIYGDSHRLLPQCP